MTSQVALQRVGPRARAALRTALWLSAAALLVLPGQARATIFLSSTEQGSWTAADKELHAAGSLAIAASIRVTGRSDAESFTAAVSVGVLKEIYDATLKPAPHKRGASWKDLAADILGAAAGVLLVRAMD
jgi:uncharacterized protein YfiM (DUF2279 family)